MPVADHLISLRERIVDGLVGSGKQTLNGASPDDKRGQSDIPRALYELMKSIEEEAVREGGRSVDYGRLGRMTGFHSARRELLPALREFDPSSLANQNEQLSFWVNLYNLLVLDAVLSFEISRSITEGFLGFVSFFRRAAYEVGGASVSLDDIEHGILRMNRGFPYFPGAHFGKEDPRLDWVVLPFDPAIHWGLNCASRSCPPLRAYHPDRALDELRSAGRSFISSTIQIDETLNDIHLSRLFKWFGSDFDNREGLIDWLLANLPYDSRREWIRLNQDRLGILFQPYDWSLNRIEDQRAKSIVYSSSSTISS